MNASRVAGLASRTLLAGPQRRTTRTLMMRRWVRMGVLLRRTVLTDLDDVAVRLDAAARKAIGDQ